MTSRISIPKHPSTDELWDSVDPAVSPESTISTREHVARCQYCREESSEMVKVLTALERSCKPPADLLDRVLRENAKRHEHAGLLLTKKTVVRHSDVRREVVAARTSDVGRASSMRLVFAFAAASAAIVVVTIVGGLRFSENKQRRARPAVSLNPAAFTSTARKPVAFTSTAAKPVEFFTESAVLKRVIGAGSQRWLRRQPVNVLALPPFARIFPPARGVVTDVSTDSGIVFSITIQHGRGAVSVYHGIRSSFVKIRESVRAESPIGYTTAPSLTAASYEVRVGGEAVDLRRVKVKNIEPDKLLQVTKACPISCD